MRDKGQGSSASQNQCCLRKVCCSQGIPLPQYSPLTEPLPVASLAAAATSSPPVFQIEKEEEVEQEEEGFVDLTLPTDDYEVFNQSSPSLNVPEDMGIQRKP